MSHPFPKAHTRWISEEAEATYDGWKQQLDAVIDGYTREFEDKFQGREPRDSDYTAQADAIRTDPIYQFILKQMVDLRNAYCVPFLHVDAD